MRCNLLWLRAIIIYKYIFFIYINLISKFCHGFRLTDLQLVNRIRKLRVDTTFAMAEVHYCPHWMLNKTIFAWIHLCLDMRYGVCPSAVTLHGSHFRAIRKEKPSNWLANAFFAMTHVRQFLCLSANALRKGSSRRAGISLRLATESGYVRLWQCIAFYCQCCLLWCCSMFNRPCLMNLEEAEQGGS